MSGQQVDFTPYTNLSNRIGLTAHNRVTVTASSSGYGPTGYSPASIDVHYRGRRWEQTASASSMVTGNYLPDKFVGDRK